jgi:2,5-diamino-6-(ribosylamino)-4(3H)-pyrimidinone 5'-phosphate reductase
VNPGEDEIYSELELPSQSQEDSSLPYVSINIVCTVDGRSSLDGKASGLGSVADRVVMRTLRSKADAVMIGGGTLRAEKLSLGLDPEDPRPRPLGVILTNTGDVPLASNLVRDSRQDVLVLVPEGADEDVDRNLGDIADIIRRVPSSAGTIDLAAALRILKSDYNIRRLLVEGGPTINHALISEGLADELFLTLSPMLLGSTASPDARGVLDGTLSTPHNLRLLSARLTGDEVFLRYALKSR